MSQDGRREKPGGADLPAEERVQALAEEYLERLHAGERPDRQAFVAAHPEIAEILEKQLAVVEMLHQDLARGTDSAGDSTPGEDVEALRDKARETADLESGDDDSAQIGPYRIRQLLGRGGMGVVYRASQSQPVRRDVALKVIKLGMDTEDIVARFESERQVLALLEHPGIAKIFDGGATERGRPFFAMELVRGLPITEHCDRARLTPRERLRLFMEVCDAVQHAHQKGIIHRDLKPSNILVTETNGRATPKIIDFGIAKATNQRLTERTVFTESGRIIGTPEYMSPEQAELRGLDIDTRSDIYSLGVVLYELLTGALPFDPETLRAAGLDEFRRRIREDEPPRPSTRISTLGDGSAEVARRRRTSPGHLVRLLRGDLDWIVMKALDKDRARRYASASEMAADIGRHIEDEPVLAKPPSATYRLGKFIRRHRRALVVASGVGLMLFTGLWIIAGMQVKTRQAEDTARLLNDYLGTLTSSLGTGSVMQKRSIADVLAHAEADIGSKFRNHPLLEAAVRNWIGDQYLATQHPQKAEEHLRIALEIREAALPENDPDLLDTMNTWRRWLAMSGRLAESRSYMIRVLDHLSISDDDTPEEGLWKRTLEAEISYELDIIDPAEVEAVYLEAAIATDSEKGIAHPDTHAAKTRLVLFLISERDWETYEDIYARWMPEYLRELGESHPFVVGGLAARAISLYERGRYEEAEEIYRDLFDEHLDVTRNSTYYFWTLSVRGRNLYALRRYEEAELHLRESIRVVSGFRPDWSKFVSFQKYFLAKTLQELGRLDEAERLIHEMTGENEGRKYAVNEGHAPFNAQIVLARQKLFLGNPEEAEDLIRHAIEAHHRSHIEEADLWPRQAGEGRGRRHLAPDEWDINARILLGIVLTRKGDLEEAETLLLETRPLILDILGPMNRYDRRVAQALVDLYLAWDRPDQAEEYRSLLR